MTEWLPVQVFKERLQGILLCPRSLYFSLLLHSYPQTIGSFCVDSNHPVVVLNDRNFDQTKTQIDSWMHHLQDINSILELHSHVVVRPVPLTILAVLKEYKERRHDASEWAFVYASKNRDGCVLVGILFSLALKVDFIKNLCTKLPCEAMLATNERGYHCSDSFILR